MKEFSHPGSDEKTFINLNELLESTLTISRNQWKYVAQLETDLQPDLPLVACLPGEINQVFLNLIVNAAHAIGDQNKEGQGTLGKITIATRQVDKAVQVRISDTGGGVPEAIKERIFEPFFTTKARGKGTGQGLAISRRVVVDKHQGLLFLQTEPGKGTTFIIELPL
jgi:signal transduction histidine kinase